MIELSPINGWTAMDPNGLLMPWYTSGALEVITGIDWHGKHVFEYGSGNSTIWYRSKGAVVFGVDHDKEWEIPGIRIEPERLPYINRIHWHQHGFDLIAIDGLFRDECLEHALQKINQGGIIVIDNWFQPSAGWPYWPKSCDLLAIKKLPHTVYREAKHIDWASLIIQC